MKPLRFAVAFVALSFAGMLLIKQRSFPAGVLFFHLGTWVAIALCLAGGAARRPDRLDALLFAFVGVHFASFAVAATNPWYAWQATAVASSGVGTFWFARTVTAAGHRSALLFAVAGFSVVLAALAVLEAYQLIPAMSSPGRAPGGPVRNRNLMAELVALALPSLVWCLYKIDFIRSRRLALGASLSLSLAALVLSRTRGAWLACFCAAAAVTFMALFVPRSLHRERWRALLACAAFAAFGIAAVVIAPPQLWNHSAAPYLNSLTRVFDYGGGTGRGRLIQYRATMKMALDHAVLGVGPGNWPVAYPEYATIDDPSYRPDLLSPVDDRPNSDLLGLVAESGAFSLIIVGFILLELGRLLVTKWRSGSFSPGLALVVVATLMIVFIAGLFDAILLRPEPFALTALAIGASLPECEPTQAPSRALRRLAVVAAVATLAFAGARPFLQLVGRARVSAHDLASLQRLERFDPGNDTLMGRIVKRALERGDCETASAEATRLARYFPSSLVAARALKACAQ